MVASIKGRHVVAVSFLNLAGQLAWAVENQYFNVFMYNKISPKTFYVSLMVALSAVTATITSITMGTLSDKLGKRKFFFLVGFPLWGVTTAIFPLAGILRPIVLAVSIAILFDCVMTFFGSTASDAVLNAYVVDITTLENRGRMSAVMEFSTILAILITYGVGGYIIDSLGYFDFFYIVGAVVFLFGLIGSIIVEEPKIEQPKTNYWSLLKSTFNIEELQENRDLFLVLLAAMFWSIAFNVFFPYVLIYLQHGLNFDLFTASLVVFIALVIAVIASIPVGLLVDKIGRKRIALIAVGVESVSLIVFAYVHSFAYVLVVGAFWVFAMMMFDISSTTWAKDLYPGTKRGQFSGYYILFTVLGGMGIGPFIGDAIARTMGKPIVIDGQPGHVPPPFIFVIAGILILLTFIPMFFADEKKKKTNSENVRIQ